MSKNNKTLLILTAVLVILAALLAGLKLYNNAQEEKKVQEEESAQIHITEAGSLSRISYNNGTEDMEVVKEGDSWTLADDPEVELQQSYFTTLETEISNLIADREIPEPDDLADYGLDNPSYTIKATDEEGNETIIYVGNGADSEYYLTTGDKDKVYTGGSALVSAMQYEIGDMIVNDTIPTIGTAQVVKININSPNGKSSYKGGSDDDEDEDAISTILGGLGALSFDGCVNYHVKNDELADYGLDKEHRIAVKITYKETTEESEDSESTSTDDSQEKQSFTLYIGNADDTGTSRYVQVKGSKIINKALADTVNNLLNESAE